MEEIGTNKNISSPKIGNNYILRNIKNAENIESHLETQHLQKALSNIKKISVREFLRYITFFILYFIIIGLQISVSDIHAQNSHMISAVLISNAQPDILISAESFQTYDIFEKYITGVIDLIAQPTYDYTYSPITGASVNYSVNSSFSPVTNVRIRQKRAQTKNGTYEWASPLQYDLSDYRPKSTNFTYDNDIGGFAIYPSFFSNEQTTIWGYENNLQEAGLEYDNFVNEGFYDEKTCEVSVDVSVVNTANELLTYIEVNYIFMPTGLIRKTIFLNTIQFTYYESSQDYVRAILEIIYLIIFAYYCLSKTSELYFEIKKTAVYEAKYKNDIIMLSNIARCVLSIKKLFKKVFFGTRNYISDLWNILDLLIISLGLWGLFQWLKVNLNRSVKDEITKIDYTNLNDENMKKLNKLNKYCENDAYDMHLYYFICSRMALVLTIKLLKYIISYSQKFSNLLRVLMNIFDTIIFFLILLVFSFLAFMFLYMGYIGSNYPIFENTYSASVFIFGLLIGASKRFKNEEEENPQFTTFFYIFFSFVMVFILMNLFLVIVKNELTKLEITRQIERTKLNKLLDKFEYTPSIFWRITQRVKKSFMNVVYYFNKKRYLLYQMQEENLKRLIQNEVNMNQNLNFDIDYQDIDNIYANILENEYTIEGEKLKYNRFFKKKMVKSVWFALFIACILIINVYVFVLLFNSSQNYEATSSILQKIDNSADLFQTEKYLLKTTSNMVLALIYLSKVVPLYFTKSYLYFPKHNTTSSSNTTTNSSENPEFAVNYLIGYNFLCENMIRFTIRKRRFNMDPNNFYFSKFNHSQLASSFHYNAPQNSNEQTADYNSSILNATVRYNYADSFEGLGGYTFHFHPDVNTTFNLMDGLYVDHFLNEQINSFVVDFVLVNPLSNNDMTYVLLIFEFDSSGNLVIQKEISTVSRNRLKTFQEKTVIGLFITIGVFFLIFTIILVKNLRETLNGYESWYCLFIKNALPEALIYHRERKKPEIMRKLKVVLTVKFTIECFYVLFNFLFYTIFVIFLFDVVRLESMVNLLGGPLDNIDSFQFDSLDPNNYQPDDKDRLNQIFNKIKTVLLFKDLAAFFASFTVFCLCFELIFYLCKNHKFNEMFKAILKSLVDLPYVFLLFVSLIVAFSISGFIFDGQYRDSFQSILISITTMLQYLYRLDDMDFLMQPYFLSISFFASILVPYIFIVKFLILNLFLSIIFRAYESTKKNSRATLTDRKNNELTFKEFLLITISFFKKEDDSEKDNKNSEIYLQTINKNNFTAVFDRFRDSIENSNKTTSIHIWATICAEEIKNEQEARSLLKSKCDELAQEYFLNSFKGNLAYFKEVNKDSNRKLIEYQLRHKYWQYLYTGHIMLNNFYQYFLNKLSFIGSKLNMDQAITEQKTEEMKTKHEEKITKVYIKDLEKKLEANLQDLRVLTQNQQKLAAIQKKFEDKMGELEKKQIGMPSKRVSQYDKLKSSVTRNSKL